MTTLIWRLSVKVGDLVKPLDPTLLWLGTGLVSRSERLGMVMVLWSTQRIARATLEAAEKLEVLSESR